MVAKDPDAASRIRHILNTAPGLQPNARMVEMSISRQGLHVTRS